MKEVRVKWIDSMSGDCFWSLLEDYKTSIARPTTYGFVVYEDDEIISIAQTYVPHEGETPEQINGVITIPKCSIIEIIDLNPKER